jgi:cobalt-zinc-cadmium efflux system outer membrane protein
MRSDGRPFRADVACGLLFTFRARSVDTTDKGILASHVGAPAMRRLLTAVGLVVAGCRSGPDAALPQHVEAHIKAVAATPAALNPVPCAAAVPSRDGPLDLAALWDLALANNPSLREAAAEVEAARGRLVQAGKYPNPRFAYNHEEIGTSVAPKGTFTVQLNQEIVTACKRQLDVAVAAAGTDVATVALVGRRFDVLARVRRAYYDYLGWRATLRTSEEVVAALERGVADTRELVEERKLRPRTDLLRIEALLEEARIVRERTRTSLGGAWRQLAADVGVPQLEPPAAVGELPGATPAWDLDAVTRRTLAASADLRQAVLEAEQARREAERARVEWVPNVVVGGGYFRSFVEETAGGLVSVETALPVWDRKQGLVHAAEARWQRALAAEQTTANRLRRDVAEAFARYEAARLQVERLTLEVLPRQVESAALVREGYLRGAAQVGFLDVLQAEQALNETRLRLADTRRDLWRAVAELEGLMQLDAAEEDCPAR